MNRTDSLRWHTCGFELYAIRVRGLTCRTKILLPYVYLCPLRWLTLRCSWSWLWHLEWGRDPAQRGKKRIQVIYIDLFTSDLKIFENVDEQNVGRDSNDIPCLSTNLCKTGILTMCATLTSGPEEKRPTTRTGSVGRDMFTFTNWNWFVREKPRTVVADTKTFWGLKPKPPVLLVLKVPPASKRRGPIRDGRRTPYKSFLMQWVGSTRSSFSKILYRYVSCHISTCCRHFFKALALCIINDWRVRFDA